MTYKNHICADAGTANCPCPLAETGCCLICGRLAGRENCDCDWAGLCIYNEYIQNGSRTSNKREDIPVRILKKNRYGPDLLVLELEVGRGIALQAAQPGAFVFLKGIGKDRCFDTPVSVLRTDVEKGRLYLALKVLSAKTKAISDAENAVMLRGIYRNGLLGGGLEGLSEDLHRSGAKGRPVKRARWLILTKGVGFAPAVNLLCWADGRVHVELVIDTEKISEELVYDQLQACGGWKEGALQIRFAALGSVAECREPENRKKYQQEDYDKIMVMASDYHIKAITSALEIPAQKLVFSNNFHMCCGEGICGACGHVDAEGNVSKMCKCRWMDVKGLL